MAEPASAVDAAHPGNTDTRSQRQLRGRPLDHFSHNLMAGNETGSNRRKISFHDVQIRPTHAASDDPKQHMSGFESGLRNLFDMKEGGGRSTS
jgi:hypothetical protein